VSSTISPPSASVQAVEGGSAEFAFTVVVTGTPSGTVVPAVSVDGIVVAVEGPVDASVANQYTVHLKTLPTVAPATYVGEVIFRLCTDATCSSVHAGTQQAFAYTASVKLGDWTTFQRDAAHSGFVNVTLDSFAFRQDLVMVASGRRPGADRRHQCRIDGRRLRVRDQGCLFRPGRGVCA